MTRSIPSAIGAIFIVGMIVALSTAGLAQPSTGSGRDDGSSEISYQTMVKNLEESIATEVQAVDEARKNANQLKLETETFSSMLDTYRIQNATQGNLLYIPETTLEDLKNAASIQKQSLDHIERLVEETITRLEVVKKAQNLTASQLKLYQKSLNEISQSSPDQAGDETVSSDMQQLVDLIAEKEAALSQVETIITGQLDELNLLKTELLEQMDLFSEKIDKKRTQERVERRAYAHDFPVWKTLTAELQDVRSQIRQIPRRDLWISKLSQIWQKGGLLLLAAGSLYIFLMIYLYRIKRLCAKLKASPFCIEFPWRSLAIRILNKSLMLIGTIVFIVVYSQLRGFYTTSTAVQLVVHFLAIFLYTGWGLSLINIWLKQPPSAISTAILHRLRVLVLAIRYTALIYISLDWLLGGDAVLLTLIRLSFEVYLIFWIIAFKKYWQRDFRAPNPKVAGTLKTLERPILWGAYTVAAIPLVLDFVGYGTLAAYWLTAIGYSAVVFFWAVIFYFILREWDQKFYNRQADSADKPAQPIKWLLFRLCWLAWGVAVILLLGFAWVGHATAIHEIARVARHTIKLGEFELSLLGGLNVFLVLFFTHIIVRLWRHTLHKRILNESGLETGLKNSIVSINVYILWSLGILVALYTFGISGTSLTVAFGALSIGLGFCLLYTSPSPRDHG